MTRALRLAPLALLAALLCASGAAAMNFAVCYDSDTTPKLQIKDGQFANARAAAAFDKAITFATRQLWRSHSVRNGCKLDGEPVIKQGCSDKVEGHPTRTKYGFVWTAHYSCPGMCSGGVCKWTQACRMRVYTRRNGSYYAAPMLRCVEQ